MKKFLLPLGLLAAGALSAAAQGTIYGEDHFDWTIPYAEAIGAGDPVGTDNEKTKSVAFEGSPAIDGNENTIFGSFWNTYGYTVRHYPDAALYEIFGYNGYIRIGGDDIHNQGIKWGGLRWNPAKFNNWNGMDSPDECYLSFDWCPFKAEDGTYDPTELYVEYRPGDIRNAAEIKHDLKDGEPMRWIHVELDLYDTPFKNPDYPQLGQITPILDGSSNFYIGAVGDESKNGRHRFYIDNLMLHSAQNAGVGSVVADSDNAPVEYYNLQGVRVAEPEGLVIRKQGRKTAKVIIR